MQFVLTEKNIFKARDYKSVEVIDRVGSGDAFVAGFIFGLLEEKGLSYAIECGAAHGVLAMTSIGDNSTSAVEEVEDILKGKFAVVKR